MVNIIIQVYLPTKLLPASAHISLIIMLYLIIVQSDDSFSQSTVLFTLTILQTNVHYHNYNIIIMILLIFSIVTYMFIIVA